MTAYYNEIDRNAAQWLRNLISEGHIAPGDVDERSIRDIRPCDVAGYDQCHFFAGFGGWSLGLRLIGWPDNRPVWTGSCPCQPFSTAGLGKGFDDPRHLWPIWFRLIRERRPAILFGEQVTNKPEWLLLVRSDLGQVGYAMAGIPIEAASAGAQSRRDRYWFMAHPTDADDWRSDRWPCLRQTPELRSDFCARDDRGGEIRVLGRVLPDASVPLLAREIPARLAQYRAFGNSIDPFTAAKFIAAAAA